MTQVIGIDPGKTTGFALFVSGKLSRAFARTFNEFIVTPPFSHEPAEVVIEFPKWHSHSREEIDDLLGLAEKAGRIEQFYIMQRKRVLLVWPSTWKGSVPKDIHNKRVLARLTPDELARVPLRPRAKIPDHNCVDAIGLGLWQLGRMG